MNSKTLSASIRKTAGKARSFTATITTDSVDRDGEVVIPAGMNSKDYERNPVLLYEHDALKPIGKMLKMSRKDRSIEAEFALAPRPEGYAGDWLPDTVAALMDFGALNTMSIGFMGTEARPASKADTERFGNGVRRVYGKWKLLEVSVVSLPANQDAIITAVRKGLVSAAAVKRFGVTVPDAPAPVEVARKWRVAVSIPVVAADDRSRIVRDEIARARGRIYAD
jgi:HK97 family phage prohead protease